MMNYKLYISALALSLGLSFGCADKDFELQKSPPNELEVCLNRLNNEQAENQRLINEDDQLREKYHQLSLQSYFLGLELTGCDPKKTPNLDFYIVLGSILGGFDSITQELNARNERNEIRRKSLDHEPRI